MHMKTIEVWQTPKFLTYLHILVVGRFRYIFCIRQILTKVEKLRWVFSP